MNIYFTRLFRVMTAAGIALCALTCHTAKAEAVVSTHAGSGALGGVNGAATSATFRYPHDVAVDAQGNVFVADMGNNLIREITTQGVVSTIAGTGALGHQNGSALSATFVWPQFLAVDGAGRLYVAEYNGNMIRRIAGGTVSNFVGSFGAGYQDGTGASAWFSNILGMTTDAAGNLYVVDNGNKRIRKITPAGVVTTVAGSGLSGFGNGPALSARFNDPAGIAVDAAGALYVADRGNNRIRKIAGGIVSTLAGTGTAGHVDGPAASAQFNAPMGIASDGAGSLFITEQGNPDVRRLDAAGNVITLAGSTAGFADGAGLTAKFAAPGGIDVFGPSRLVYLADADNHRIRKIVDVAMLKVCKVAGAGVAVGTPVVFTTTAPGTVDGEMSVPAGPAPGGYCNVSPALYAVGATVTVREVQAPGNIVSAITVAPEAQMVSSDIPEAMVSLKLSPGVTETAFTDTHSLERNASARLETGRASAKPDGGLSGSAKMTTGYIEVCKTSNVAGNYTFNVSGGAGTVVVPAGACSPPVRVFPGTVVVTEPGLPATTIWMPASCCSTFPTDRMQAYDTTAHTITVTVPSGDISSETIVRIGNVSLVK